MVFSKNWSWKSSPSSLLTWLHMDVTPDDFPRYRLKASFFFCLGSATGRSVTVRLITSSCIRFISWGLKVFQCIRPSAIDGKTLPNMGLPSVCVLQLTIRRVLTQGVWVPAATRGSTGCQEGRWNGKRARAGWPIPFIRSVFVPFLTKHSARYKTKSRKAAVEWKKKCRRKVSERWSIKDASKKSEMLGKGVMSVRQLQHH